MVGRSGSRASRRWKSARTPAPSSGRRTCCATSARARRWRKRSARAEAEAAASVKSQFMANMSHELRTPLTSIIGFTKLAMAQPDMTPSTRGYVERVADASQALLCAVNDILDFSKLEAGQVAI